MVLVTGANGLVGSYLCRYLLLQGEKVRALKRKNSNLYLLDDIKDNIEWVDGDVLDAFSLEDAVEGIDKIYHCAAIVSYVKSKKALLMLVNVEGTANIVNCALENNIKKLVYISSIAALGRTGKADEIVTEKTPWERKHLTSDYAISKFLGEREVWRGIAEGLHAVIVNPSIIVGAGNWDSGSSKLFKTVNDGFKFYTEGITGYVDVRDVVKISYSLMESDIENERFILNSENVPYKIFLSEIATALKVKGPHIKAGKLLSSIAWRMEKLKSIFSGVEPTVTKQTATIANKKVYFENKKIVERLQYQFIPISTAIQDAAKSYTHELKTGIFEPVKF